MNDYPVIFCLVCLPTATVEYTSISRKAVQGFFDCMPEEVRDLFEVVEYRANNENEKE